MDRPIASADAQDRYERIAEGWELLEVADREEGELPRRLFAVTMRRA